MKLPPMRSSGIFGLARGQIARINAVHIGDPGIKPIELTIAFVNASGVPLAHEMKTVHSGEAIDPSVEDVLDEAQAGYRRDLEGQKLQAKVTAERADELTDAIAEEQNANVASGEFDTFDTVSPTIEEMPKPRQMRRRYVRRGVLYRKAKHPNVKLKRGEPVFIRNEEGEYERIGNVGHNGALPVAYLEEENE
jgi:hypothetical protein